jgi:hypothetical protein
MLLIIMLSVIRLSVFMLYVTLFFVILSVIMMNVTILSLYVECRGAKEVLLEPTTKKVNFATKKGLYKWP